MMEGRPAQGGVGSQPNDDGSDESQFTEQYAAFLAEHRENKARLKAEVSRSGEEAPEVARNAYLDKLQGVDEQLQTLQTQKQEIADTKSRHQHSSLSRDELPNLDDLERDFHTILRMRKIAADSIAEMQTAASPSQTKLAKGEQLVGNLDSILAKRAILVDTISSFASHMSGHDSLQMTPGLHAELDAIYQRKAELAADMRALAGSPTPPGSVADLQNRLNEVYTKKEEALTEMHGEGEGGDGATEKLVWKRTEFPTKPTTRAAPKHQQPEPQAEEQKAETDEAQKGEEEGEKLVWKRTEFPSKPTKPAEPKSFQPLLDKDNVANQLLSQDSVQEDPVQDPAEGAAEVPNKSFQPLFEKDRVSSQLSAGEQGGNTTEQPAGESEEKLVWKRTEFPTKKAEQTPAKGAGEPEGKDENQGPPPDAFSATPSVPHGDPPPPPTESAQDAGPSREAADAILFAELSRLIELLKNQENSNPEGSNQPSSSPDYDVGVDEIASLGEAMRNKIDELQKDVDDVTKNGGKATQSPQKQPSLSQIFEEKRKEIVKIEEFAGLCKQSRLPEAQAFLPIVRTKMDVLKADISALETQTIEMQTEIEDTGISQPTVLPIALAAPDVQLTVNETIDMPQPSLRASKIRVREALNNVAYTAIAFCAFGLAVFVLGIFAPVGFPSWGPAICLATVGAFYSSTRANGVDTPVYPGLFRNAAFLACLLLLVSAVLFGLAFFSIMGLKGTPACSSAVLYSPECMEPIIGANGTAPAVANETPCFNDLSLEEYNRRVKNCEKLLMCFDGKVNLAPCDLMVAINGFGALFSVSLAVTISCVSMWVYAHLETRIREYKNLRERIQGNQPEEGDTDTFVPMSTATCLRFYGCGCFCCCCGQGDVGAGNRLRNINDSSQPL